MSKFQVILTSIFIVCILGGVALFATYRGQNRENRLPAITLWGTLSSSVFDLYVNKLNTNREEPLEINYVEIAESDFDKTFIEALARGQGPDAILISQNSIHRHADKIIPIPYDVFTQRDFQNTFIEQSELYLYPQGIMALPLVIDPLVMYWNRDIFTNAGIAVFPKFWDEFSQVGSKITVKDSNSNIRRSALALGEFSNIDHAREILGALFLQSGNPVTFWDNSSVSSALKNDNALPALNFFTKFADPRDPDYSWNRSLSISKNSFLAGVLATYIGFASEINDLREKNPNINFDIAPLPQAHGGANRATFGSMYGLSIVKSAYDVNSTYTVLSSLITPEALSEMVSLAYLPPVRRDMIAGGSTDPYLSIFYDSALISKGWLDTDKNRSYAIFQNIVESVTSGRRNPPEALRDGSDEFDLSLKNI